MRCINLAYKDINNSIINFIRVTRIGTKQGFIRWVEMPKAVVDNIKTVILDNIESAFLEQDYQNEKSSVFVIKTEKEGNKRYRFGFYRNIDNRVILAPNEFFINDDTIGELVALYQVVAMTVYKQRLLELNEQVQLFTEGLGKLFNVDYDKKE